jgi:hypothetical protein
MDIHRRKADRAYLDTNLSIPKQVVNVEGVKSALTFTYFEGADREERKLPLYKETLHHIEVPRAFWAPGSFGFKIVDLRPTSYRKTKVSSKIQLDHTQRGGKLVPTGETKQREASSALLASHGGTLQLGCGGGKTVIALHVIAQLNVPAIIIVDTTQLILQWQEAISNFLDVPGGVGLIQADVFNWKKSIVMATYHTLAARSATFPEEVKRWFGVAIWDEAHHVSAPTFSKSADLFYGRRYGLSATPKRDDGLHVIHEFHFGDVLYRDLIQELKPHIYFNWTGLKLDNSDPYVVNATHSSGGKLHLSKLATYYGEWAPRLQIILAEIRRRVVEGRKILVLSNSVNELVNLLALWNQEKSLYTDVPVPTPQEVGETLPPIRLSTKELLRIGKKLAAVKLKKPTSETLLLTQKYETALAQHEVARKVDSLFNQRQTDYRNKLLARPSTAGLMIHKVPSTQRMKMLREKQVTFAISKYGKEGLDESALDTILLCEPMSSRSMLQQVMGRIQRRKEGKKDPVMIVFEDNIGPMMGMCNKMRRHLRSWPIGDGGPYAFELVNYPRSK